MCSSVTASSAQIVSPQWSQVVVYCSAHSSQTASPSTSTVSFSCSSQPHIEHTLIPSSIISPSKNKNSDMTELSYRNNNTYSVFGVVTGISFSHCLTTRRKKIEANRCRIRVYGMLRTAKPIQNTNTRIAIYLIFSLSHAIVNRQH